MTTNEKKYSVIFNGQCINVTTVFGICDAMQKAYEFLNGKRLPAGHFVEIFKENIAYRFFEHHTRNNCVTKISVIEH